MKFIPPRSTLFVILLGIGSCMQLISFAALFVILIGLHKKMFSSVEVAVLSIQYAWLFVFVSVFVGLAIALYYICIAVTSNRPDRWMWVVLLMAITPIASPLFWWRVIVRRERTDSPVPPAPAFPSADAAR
jgi:hypothetical protein